MPAGYRQSAWAERLPGTPDAGHRCHQRYGRGTVWLASENSDAWKAAIAMLHYEVEWHYWCEDHKGKGLHETKLGFLTSFYHYFRWFVCIKKVNMVNVVDLESSWKEKKNAIHNISMKRGERFPAFVLPERRVFWVFCNLFAIRCT